MSTNVATTILVSTAIALTKAQVMIAYVILATIWSMAFVLTMTNVPAKTHILADWENVLMKLEATNVSVLGDSDSPKVSAKTWTNVLLLKLHVDITESK